MNEIEQYIDDAVIERPYGFTVAEKRFYLYPVTLGKMFLLKRLTERLEINEDNLRNNISLEALRLVNEKLDLSLTLIVYHTCKTKEEIHDIDFIAERKDFFRKELDKEDIVSLLMVVLTSDKTSLFMKHFGIDKEQDRMSAVIRAKTRGDKNNLSFGGLSIFGTLLDAACDRYKWTKDYVVWGIDYTSLRLMLADKVVSMFISDDERKKIPPVYLEKSDDIIRGDDPNNMQIIRQMNWK